MKNDCLFCAIAGGEIPSNKVDVYKRQPMALATMLWPWEA